MANKLKTFFLITLLSLFFLFLGHTIAGPRGFYFALIFSFIFNIVSFWYSDKIVLKMYKAKEIARNNESGLYEIVEKLARKARLPMPKVYITPSENMNAFATGRNYSNAAVAVTSGLINKLNKDELEGVLAHEISHIKNRDTLISTFTAIVASSIMYLTSIAKWGLILTGRGGSDRNGGNIFSTILMIIIAPIVALLIQAAISRSREYIADSDAKKLIGTGVPLANALKKISKDSVFIKDKAEISPQTSHMFIFNPISSKSFFTLFSTHPSVEDRVERLLH